MRGTEVVFNQLRIFAFVVSLFALCCVRVESSLSIEKPDGGIRFGQNVETEKISIDRSDFCMTQFLRAENWRGKILQEILNKGIVSDETVIDGDSLKRSLWKTVPQMLYDFGTSTGWFAKNLITANGYIDFGEAETVGRFSSSELIYVLLANALVLDAMNRFKSLEDIACPLNVYYGQVIFSRELIRVLKNISKFCLRKEKATKWRVVKLG